MSLGRVRGKEQEEREVAREHHTCLSIEANESWARPWQRAGGEGTEVAREHHTCQLKPMSLGRVRGKEQEERELKSHVSITPVN